MLKSIFTIKIIIMTDIFNVSMTTFPAIIPPHDVEVGINNILPIRDSPEYSEMEEPPSYNPPLYEPVKRYIKKQKYVYGRIVSNPEIKRILDLFFIDDIIAYQISGYWITDYKSSNNRSINKFTHDKFTHDKLVTGPNLEPAILQIKKSDDTWILIIIPLSDSGNIKGRITCQVYIGNEDQVYISSITQINIEHKEIFSISHYDTNRKDNYRSGNRNEHRDQDRSRSISRSGDTLCGIPKLFHIDVRINGFKITEYLPIFNNVIVLRRDKIYNLNHPGDERPVPLLKYSYEYFIYLQTIILHDIIMY